LRRAARALDKAVSKGLLHRNNASRRVARLSRAVSKLKAAGA
jgi:ribosomal protein S20